MALGNYSRILGTSGLALVAATTMAAAQETDSAAQLQRSWNLGEDEIVVTARRREESLQDVPSSVNAVSQENVQKLNLQRFEDIQAVVPGLNLSSGNSGYSTTATLRGASFQAESGANPTVEFYLNDALIQSVFLFQSMFDIGQIEVLRGPQGTLRGRASPSGSITYTTKRPDLDEMGGYVSLTGTAKGEINANGAIGLPVAGDVLAVRIAGIVDHNEYDQVTSLNNSTDPSSKLWAVRGTALFEPTDTFSATVMYQHLKRKLHSYTPVQSLSLLGPSADDGPRIIRPEDRHSILATPAFSEQMQDIVTAQINWEVLGQQLSYVGSFSRGKVDAFSPDDSANALPDHEWGQSLLNSSRQWTHEVRVSSVERLFGLLDYTVGAFVSDFTPRNRMVRQSPVVMPPSLGGGLVSIAETPIFRDGKLEESSVFGNLTLHFGDGFEVSGGLRYIDWKNWGLLEVNDAVLSDRTRKTEKVVYNLSASYRASEQFMVYANTGSSFRPGTFLNGVFRPATPLIDKYTDLEDETSTSYELGFKSTFLDNRVRFNAAAFYQKFNGFLYRGTSVAFIDLTRSGPAPASFNFGANVDTRIYGFEADLTIQPLERLSAQATFSYANSKIQDEWIACTDLNNDGIPDINPGVVSLDQLRAVIPAGEAVAQCRVNDRADLSPKWSLSLQTEYYVPVQAGADAFVRGLFTYYPSNESSPYNAYDNVDDYGLLNLYTGLRSPDGNWEVSLFAKNLLNTKVVLSRDVSPVSTSVQQLQPPAFRSTSGISIPSSYIEARMTAPRVFGLSLRYTFGAR